MFYAKIVALIYSVASGFDLALQKGQSDLYDFVLDKIEGTLYLM